MKDTMPTGMAWLSTFRADDERDRELVPSWTHSDVSSSMALRRVEPREEYGESRVVVPEAELAIPPRDDERLGAVTR